jgi:hypothetical protein
VRRLIHEIRVDDCALEGELRINCGFARTGCRIAHDLNVAGTVCADRRESAIGDDVVDDHDVVGAESVDSIAELASSTVAGKDAFDAIPRHHRAVVARLPAMDQDTAITAVADRITRYAQTHGVYGVDACIGRA